MGVTMLIHIIGGSVGLVAGFVALYVAKGERLHRRSGMLFVFAMLALSITGSALALIHRVEASVVGGFLSTYLVITAFTAVRNPTPGLRRLDIGAMLLGFAVGVSSVGLGLESLLRGEWVRDGVPILMLFIFGSVALAASVSDARVLRSAPLRGNRRIVRHLWRMCFALFMASASFFLGQADELPEVLRIPGLLAIPAFLPLLVMGYWLVRMRLRSSLRTLSPARPRDVV